MFEYSLLFCGWVVAILVFIELIKGDGSKNEE